MRNLLDITDLTPQEINSLLSIAMDIIKSPEKYNTVCKGKKLATLFYEPSTRTRLSFSAAMMELGGNVLGFSDANASSVSKGETVADTVRVISCLADIIAMRHNKDGAPWVASQFASVPVINAGDGSHCHPTQTLADLLTVKRRKGGFDNLTVGFCGDLKYGRTVHSFTRALGRYKGIKFVFISPEELKIPNYLRQDIENKGFSYLETDSLDKHIASLDILYMTRIQKERFDDEEQYNRLKDSFILDVKKMNNGKSDMIVLHPLPRVNEIVQEVDFDPRACYFEQVLNGKYIRMALIYSLLQWRDGSNLQPVDYEVVEGGTCNNSKCISSTEQVKPLFKLMPSGKKSCFYCDELV